MPSIRERLDHLNVVSASNTHVLVIGYASNPNDEEGDVAEVVLEGPLGITASDAESKIIKAFRQHVDQYPFARIAPVQCDGKYNRIRRRKPVEEQPILTVEKILEEVESTPMAEKESTPAEAPEAASTAQQSAAMQSHMNAQQQGFGNPYAAQGLYGPPISTTDFMQAQNRAIQAEAKMDNMRERIDQYGHTINELKAENGKFKDKVEEKEDKIREMKEEMAELRRENERQKDRHEREIDRVKQEKERELGSIKQENHWTKQVGKIFDQATSNPVVQSYFMQKAGAGGQTDANDIDKISVAINQNPDAFIQALIQSAGYSEKFRDAVNILHTAKANEDLVDFIHAATVSLNELDKHIANNANIEEDVRQAAIVIAKAIRRHKLNDGEWPFSPLEDPTPPPTAYEVDGYEAEQEQFSDGDPGTLTLNENHPYGTYDEDDQ